MMIDIRTGEVLCPELDQTCWKEKKNFIVFTDHKVAFCKVEWLRTLNGIYTLDN